jgi:hypothetical protein
MEAMQALYAIPGIGPVLPYLSLAAVIMMLIAPALPPPAAGSSMLYKFFYKLVNAHNWGYAVNAYMVQPMETPAPPELQARPPEVQKMVGKTPIASLLGMALLMGVLSACASQGSGIAETKVALTLADRLAVVYITAPACPSPDGRICSDAATVAKIKAAASLAYSAVKQAEAGKIDPAQAAAEVAALALLIPTAPALAPAK